MKTDKVIVKKLALYGVMTALALILAYVESLIPPFFAVPGIKLGLSNLVVLLMLYLVGERSAVTINFVRIGISALLFGNGLSFVYSLAGGLLSGLVMILLKKTDRFSIVTVSIAGGVAHILGQILAAVVILGAPAVAWYFVILWFTGLLSGAVIGLLGGLLCRRLEKTKPFSK